MPMQSPPHPGQNVRVDCLEPFGLTVADGARILGVSRQALSSLVNGRAGISPEMSIRLSKAFGGEPRTWLKLQLQYDLAKALEKADKIYVRPYSPA